MRNETANQDRSADLIDLKGYPLHKPLWQVFHQSAVFTSAALTSVFAVAADAYLTGGAHVAESVLACMPSQALALILASYSQKFILNSSFGTDLQKYAIDTRPDHKTPPTSEANLSKALKAKMFYGSAFLIQSGVNMLFTAPEMVIAASKSKAEFVATLLDKLTFFAPFYAMYGAGYLRFHKIANLDHAIVDPPAKKAEKKIEAGQQQTAFQPI